MHDRTCRIHRRIKLPVDPLHGTTRGSFPAPVRLRGMQSRVLYQNLLALLLQPTEANGRVTLNSCLLKVHHTRPIGGLQSLQCASPYVLLPNLDSPSSPPVEYSPNVNFVPWEMFLHVLDVSETL